MTQAFTWILGAIAAYRLWENMIWLSIVVIILAFSFQVSPEEQYIYKMTGNYDNITSRRLMLTTLGVVIIFIISFFV